MRGRPSSAVLVAAGLLLALQGPAQGQVVTGAYVGNAVDNRAITGLGFQPDVVIIKGDNSQTTAIRTSTMAGDLTKPLSATILTADIIQSLDADGFTIGTNARVNSLNDTYYWTAYKATAGEVAVGSYTGNGLDNRNITGVGFQPDYVIVISAGADKPVQRFSPMVGDVSLDFPGGTVAQADQIQALQADGFQVGTDATVNSNTVAYHYIAWKSVAGRMAVGAYTGDGTDDRNITGVGFQPVEVFVKRDASTEGVHHPASLGVSVDISQRFGSSGNGINRIQALLADGFQVGGLAVVNTTGTYFWAAFGIQCSAVADATYLAVNAQSALNTQAILYWSSSSPVLILRKLGSAPTTSEAPVNGMIYPVGASIGSATVIYDGAAASLTDTGLTAGTTYYYKVFGKGGPANACFAPGKAVNASLPTGAQPTWAYMVEGGPILKAGVTGDATIYTSSNASRIISLGTGTGTPNWGPVATTGPVQGWLTWLPLGGGGGIQSVQSGTVTMTTTSQTATITSVNTGRSFVLCRHRTNSSTPARRVTCELTNPTTITFTNNEADASVVVSWYVAEFKGGVSVQRGATSFGSSDTTINVPISAVDLSRSFVLISERTVSVSALSDERWTVRARLTSATNLELSRNVALIQVPVTWQVVQMAQASVQRGLTTIPAGQASATAGINPVTTGASFLVMSRRGATSFTGVEAQYEVRGEITDATTLTFTRVSTTNPVDIAWEVVSMSDGTTVQRGVAATAAVTDEILNVPIAAIDTARTVPLIWTSGGAGANTADLDATSYTAAFTATTNLQLQRTSSMDVNAQVAWQAVQFSQTAGVPTTFGGDQSGRVYSVDATLGATNWTVDLKTVTASDADAIQAPVSAQIRASSSLAFQAAYTDDVIFAATSNSIPTPVCGSANTNNQLFALLAGTGQVLWRFNQICTSNVDQIVGQPWVDYALDRIYVASRAGASGTQPSLWVINSLNGALVTSIAGLGHLQTSPTVSFTGATLYVGDTVGNLHAVDLLAVPPALKWTVALGGNLVGFVWEDAATPGRLYMTTADGNVRCVQDNGTSASACSGWTLSNVPGASTPLLLDKLFVGSSDGKVHQINLTTGVDEKQFPAVGTLDGTTVGDVSTETGNEIFVGTNGGKIFKIDIDLVGGALP